MLEYRLAGASCRPAQPSARAWGRSSTPAFTPFCPTRSRGGRCSRRRPRFPRDPRRTTRCRVGGLRLRNPAFRSGHRTIWDRRSGLAQCRTSCRDSVGRSPRARPAPTTCRRDSAPTSAAGGAEVRRLIPGGRQIRTIGPGTKEPVFVAEGELRDRARAAKKGCFFMRYRWFESISLQRRVCELSVPLLSRPEGDVRGIGFQTVRTYIAIDNSEARRAMLARTIFGVAENSQAYRGPRARHPPRIEAF